MRQMPTSEQPVHLPRLWVQGAVSMGKVASQVKVMPTSPEVDLDALESRLEDALPDGADLNDTGREDIAFGLVAIIAMVVIPDDAGGTEAVEEAFAAVDEVESVSIENVTRI